MRWKSDPNKWRWAFALFPVEINGEWIWLEFFHYRYLDGWSKEYKT